MSHTRSLVYLITGGCGFLGRHMLRVLLEKEDRVREIVLFDKVVDTRLEERGAASRRQQPEGGSRPRPWPRPQPPPRPRHADWSMVLYANEAPSKEALRELCSQSFQRGAPESGRLAQRAAEDLDVPFPQAQQLLQSLHSLAHHVVFHSLTRPDQIQDLFPVSFHASLKNLLTKILLELSPTWRSEVIQEQTFDWRVDMVTSSDSVSRMAVPSCLLHLQLGEDQVVVESSRETLDTMLDGLGRLRQQLALVAGK
ncbi:unnamed protein product [Merluccius merluccius]